MKKILLLSFLLVPSFGIAADIYVAQNAAGADSGLDCADAHSAAWFNGFGNWGTGGAQVGPGTTVHLCGTIASTLIAQGSGAAGSPITIRFETGAKLSQPACSIGGCLSINSLSFLTVDCGANGIIEATANGDGFPNKIESKGIYIAGSSNIEVKNCTIQNIYVHTQNSSSGGSPETFGIFADGNTNESIHDNVVSQAKYCIGRGASSGSNLNWYKNTLSKCNWLMRATVGGVGAVLDIVNIHDNDWTMGNEWDDPLNANHHNGLYAFAGQDSSGVLDHLAVYNNYCHGAAGQAWTSTGCIFINYRIPNVWVFNNVFSGVAGDPANGYIVVGAGVGTQSSLIANNTMVGTSNVAYTIPVYGTIYPKCIGLGPSSSDGPNPSPNMTVTIRNNICSTAVYGEVSSPVTTISQDRDVMFNAATIGAINGVFYGTFAQWQGAGFDPNGTASNPLLSSDYHLSAGSPAIGLGANLTSLCSGQPNPGLGALCFDRAGFTRARSGAWDAGAYQISSSNVTALAPAKPQALRLQ